MAQCISIDITFADLLSVNESTATSLFGNVSLFQSLSPEHIQRVQNAIADAISDHRATDAMLSFCSATSAEGVYAMNIKQQALYLPSRRASTFNVSSTQLNVDTSGFDDSQSLMSPPSHALSSNVSELIEASVSSASEVSQIHHSLETALMFVRIGRLTSDGKFELLCFLLYISIVFHSAICPFFILVRIGS